MRNICDAERSCIMERFDELGGTIDGARATVCGRKLDFPFVVSLDGSNKRIEYTWATLRHLVDTGRVHIRTHRKHSPMLVAIGKMHD